MIAIPDNLSKLKLAVLLDLLDQIQEEQYAKHGYFAECSNMSKIKAEVRRRQINYYDNHNQPTHR